MLVDADDPEAVEQQDPHAIEPRVGAIGVDA